MAFADLKSEEAQARLSVCQPISGLQEVTRVGGVEDHINPSHGVHDPVVTFPNPGFPESRRVDLKPCL